MIANISQGSGFRGCLDYVFTQIKDPEIIGTNMVGANPRELAAEFGLSRQMRPGVSKPCYHISLSLPPPETVTELEWDKIAENYLKKMGLNPYGTDDMWQYVAIRHHDTDHDHIHIIVSKISLEGET